MKDFGGIKKTKKTKQNRSADVDLTLSIFDRSWSTTNENAHRSHVLNNIEEITNTSLLLLKQLDYSLSISLKR